FQPAAAVVQCDDVLHGAALLQSPPYFHAAAQAPSPETMQGPTGSAGVQTLPNSGQVRGAHTPRSTAPQRQPGTSVSGPGAMLNFLAASQGANSSRMAYPLAGISPSPRQTLAAGWNTRSMAACAAGLPCARTTRVYSFSSAGRPSASIPASRQTAYKISPASKPLTTAGRPNSA